MKYEINGRVVETQKELSEAEIDEIGAHLGSAPLTKQGSLGDVFKAAIKAALPSEEYNKPIAPTSPSPITGALQAAGQTFRDPTRILATTQQPGQIAGEKIGGLGGFATSMALDPSTYIGLGGAKVAFQKGLPKLGTALEETGAKATNYVAGINYKTVEAMTKQGQNAADVGISLGKRLAQEKIISSSPRQTLGNLMKARQVAGSEVGKAIANIKKAVGDKAASTIMETNKALQPLFNAVAERVNAVTSARKAMAKPFQEAFNYLLETGSKKGNTLGLDDIRKVMEEVGPMTSKGSEEVQAAMRELYGTLANVQDHMVSTIANATGDKTLKTALLTANEKYSLYSRILPDIKHTASKASVGKGFANITESLKKIATAKTAGLATRTGTALKGFPVALEGANAEALKKVKATLSNQRGSLSIGPESQKPSLEAMRLREMWGELATEQSGTSAKLKAPYIHPEVFLGDKPNIKVYVKGIQKDIKGKPHKIWGVRGNPEVLKKWFGDSNPGSVPETVLKRLGLI